MNPSKRIISKSEIYKGVGKIPDPAPLDPRFESCWELPGSIGAGTVLAMELRQGLDLLVFNCSLRESLVSSAEDLPTIGFNFMVAGGIMGQFPGKREAEIIRSGQNSVAYSPDQSGSMKNLTQSRVRIVSIQISLNAFNTFFPLGLGTCELAGITAGVGKNTFIPLTGQTT